MGLTKVVTFIVFCLFAMRSEGGLYFRCPLHPCLCETGDMGLVMNCRQRFLTRIPPVIPSDLNFQKLSLNKNNIRSLETKAFKGIKVKKIDLSENIITNIAEDAFDGLENILEELVIQVYAMDGLPFKALRNLRALRVLHVIGCKVPVLTNDTFSLVPNLEEIRLKTCGIEVVEPSAFCGLEKTLKVLDLFGNDLQTIPASSLIGLKNVNKVVLTGNHIETVENQAFVGMSNLAHLELSSNGIQYIHPMAFDGTQASLVFLGLQRNRLKGKDMEALKILRKLNQLELAYNQIQNIPLHLFRNLNRLTLIGLQSNKIQRISRLTFTGTEQELKVLLLSDNLVRLIEPNTFSGFQKLRHLYLDRTSAGIGLSRHSFKGLAKSLETLNMQRSGFTASGFLAISELAELKTLVLRDNQITSLPPLIFSQLRRLSKLDLQSNKLKSITDPQTFEGLEKSLRQLVLSNNLISTVSECVFEKFEQLRDIVLNQNPLHCDCRIMWLKDWIISKTSMFSRNNLNWICTGPPQHTGKLFREVKDTDMTCSAEISKAMCLTEKQRMVSSTDQPTTPLSTTKENKSTGITGKQTISTRETKNILTEGSTKNVKNIKHQLLLPDIQDPAFQQDLFYNDIIQRTVQLMASKLDDSDKEGKEFQRRRHRFKQPLNKMVTSHGRKRTLARWLSSTRRMYTKPNWVSRRPVTTRTGKSDIRQENQYSTRKINQRRKSTGIPLRMRTVSPRSDPSVKNTGTPNSDDQPSAKSFTAKRRPTILPNIGTSTTKQIFVQLPPQVDGAGHKFESLLNLTSAAASGRIKSTSDSSNSNRIRNPFLPPKLRGMWTIVTEQTSKKYIVYNMTTAVPINSATQTTPFNRTSIKELETSTQTLVKPTERNKLFSTNVSEDPNNAFNSTKDDSFLNVTYKARINNNSSTLNDTMVTSSTIQTSSNIVDQNTKTNGPLNSSISIIIAKDQRTTDYVTLEEVDNRTSDILQSTTVGPSHPNDNRRHLDQTVQIADLTVSTISMLLNSTYKPSHTIKSPGRSTHVRQHSSNKNASVDDPGLIPSTSKNTINSEFFKKNVSKSVGHYSTSQAQSNQTLNLKLLNLSHTSQNVPTTLPPTPQSTVTTTTGSTPIKSALQNLNKKSTKLADRNTASPLNVSSPLLLQTTETIHRSTSPNQYERLLLYPTIRDELKASTTIYMPNNYHQDKNKNFQRDKGNLLTHPPTTTTTENHDKPVTKSYTNTNSMSTTLTKARSATKTTHKQNPPGNAIVLYSNISDSNSSSDNMSVSTRPETVHSLSPTYLSVITTMAPKSTLKYKNSTNSERKTVNREKNTLRPYNKTSKYIKPSSATEQFSVSQNRLNQPKSNITLTNHRKNYTSTHDNDDNLVINEVPSKSDITPTLSTRQHKISTANVASTITRHTQVNITTVPSLVLTSPLQTPSQTGSIPTKHKTPYFKPKVKPVDLRNPYTKENEESKYIYTGRPPTKWKNSTALKNWLNSAMADKAKMYPNGSLESVKLSKSNFPPHQLKEGRVQNPYELLKNFRKINSRLNLADATSRSDKNVHAQGKPGQKLHTTDQSVMTVNNTSFGENTSLVNMEKAEETSIKPLNTTSGPRPHSNAVARNEGKDNTETKSDQQGNVTLQLSVKPTLQESNIVDKNDQSDINRAPGTTSSNISLQLASKVQENSSLVDVMKTKELAKNDTMSTVLTEKMRTSTQITTQSTFQHTIDVSHISRSPNTSAQGRILDDLFASKNSTQIDRYNIPDFAIYVSIFPYASNAVKIKWNVSHEEKVSGFRVYYGEADNDTLLEGPSLAGNVRTYDITSLLPMQRYTFCVVAYLFKTEMKKHGHCKELTIEFEEELKTVSSGQKTKTLALIIGSYGAGALVLVTLLLSIALLVRRYRDKSKTGLYVPRSSPYWIEFLCGGFATSRYSNTVLDSSTATVSSGVEMSENDSHSDSDESGTYSFDYSLRSLPAQHIWSTADLHTNLYTY